jgi:DNA-binding response OmpR family regulator
MPGPKLLIVEDEFLIRLTLSEALQDDGFQVLEAGSGDEAAELLRADGAVALLITDVQLPGSLDGRQLAEQARAARPELPVIFMTGRPDSVAGVAPSARNVFISKPYLPSEICAAARRLTDG